MNGTRFQPDADVEVAFDNPVVSVATTTSSAGTFSTPFTIPAGAVKGTHVITATVTGTDGTVVAKTCSVRVQV